MYAGAQFRIFDSDDIIIDRPLGTAGVMNITSYSTDPRLADTGEGIGLDASGLRQLASQSVEEDGVTVRLYAGRVTRGQLQGARVVLKAYPQAVGAAGAEADRMASNELRAHAALQPPSVREESEYMNKLLGGIVVRGGASAGEQWLVFRNDGIVTAAEYAGRAAQAGAAGEAVGEQEFWDRFDTARPLQRRKVFLIKILRQVLEGLQYMHTNNRLHQSLGPGSVVLSTAQERDAGVLRVRLRDLAFSVDVSNEALMGGATIAELWEGAAPANGINSRDDFSDGLWRRARAAGADTPDARRKFGVADDIYCAGLLLLFMVFVPLSVPGTIDGPALQRLVETTFRLDFEAFRDYADADENWREAVAFMDAADGAGWDLVRAMMQAEWRSRPTVSSCLLHPFLKGAGIE